MKQGDAPVMNTLSKFRGCLSGLAVCDALGVTNEHREPSQLEQVSDFKGGGFYRLPPGAWTDDTSMALCLAESLVKTGTFDPKDQMTKYLQWYENGHYTSTGRVTGVGSTTTTALQIFKFTGEPFCGSIDADRAGNGSLMRIAPVAMRYVNNLTEALKRAADSSRTTHGARTAVDSCVYFCGLLIGALRGADKRELKMPFYSPKAGFFDQYRLSPEIQDIASGEYIEKSAKDLKTTGFVAHTLEAALFAFHNTKSFEEGALFVANLGGDCDTIGAVYGQLAGAYYGYEAIPEHWRFRLVKAGLIVNFADQLYQLAFNHEPI